MSNYKLVIQYDGTRYKGWQRLGNQENTIQGKIEHVLSEMMGTKVEIIGSSRTDAGVHALEQVANVKIADKRSERDVKRYLNHYLPKDISVKDVELVDDRFHARYNAKDKTYLYQIWNEEHTNPFLRNYAMHVTKKLDIEKMIVASTAFVGEHDFTAFSNAKSKKKSMVRTIHSLQIEEHEGLIQLRVTGDGFLYNMVRKMVGTLIEVGLGHVEPDAIQRMIESKERNRVNVMAFAGGLHLERVSF